MTKCLLGLKLIQVVSQDPGNKTEIGLSISKRGLSWEELATWVLEDLKGQISNCKEPRKQQQLEATMRQGQRKYILLPRPRSWSYLEGTRVIGGIVCHLEVQPEKGESIPPSFFPSLPLQSHVGSPINRTQPKAS